MASMLIEMDMPETLEALRLPSAVNRRLQHLLNRQDRGDDLTAEERREADGLVDVAELLSLLRLRVRHVVRESDG